MLGLATPVMSNMAKPATATVERTYVDGRLRLMLIGINFIFND